MKALILAAGYATRLYPLTKEYPKPLLKVGDRPIIDYIVEKLDTLSEINEIIVITNSKFFSKFKDWRKGLNSKKRISLIDDLTKNYSDRRGAIGDTEFAIDKKRIKDDLLVIGGDNIFEGDLKEFISFISINGSHPIIGVYNIKDKARAKKYGVVKLDDRKKIINFQEKPKVPKSSMIAMCLYYFPKTKLKLIKEYLDTKTDKYDATGFYVDWLRKKVAVYGFVFDGRWYDIGHPAFYKEAKRRFIN